MGLSDFEGKVVSVEFESGGDETRRQYHIKIDPTSIKVGGLTNLIHEWCPLSPKATEEQVPQGSVMDRYLTHVEIVVPEAKKVAKIGDALKLLIGKTFQFKKLKLGKDFNGQPAKEYIVPVARK